MAKNHSIIVYTDDPKDWAEYRRQLSQQEIDEMCQGIAQAEKAGMFDDMFCGECKQDAILLTKELLLESISPDMKLYKSTFLKIYGYEISYPGFSDIALKKLEDIGCQRAREYYEQFVTEYEEGYREKLKDTVEWYQKQCDDEWERRERKGEKLRDQKAKLQNQQNMSRATNWETISSMLGFKQQGPAELLKQ